MGYVGRGREDTRLTLGDFGLLFYNPTNFPAPAPAPSPTPVAPPTGSIAFIPPPVSAGPVNLAPVVSSTPPPPAAPGVPVTAVVPSPPVSSQGLLMAPQGAPGGTAPDLSMDSTDTGGPLVAPGAAPAAPAASDAVPLLMVGAVALGALWFMSRGRR